MIGGGGGRVAFAVSSDSRRPHVLCGYIHPSVHGGKQSTQALKKKGVQRRTILLLEMGDGVLGFHICIYFRLFYTKTTKKNSKRT